MIINNLYAKFIGMFTNENVKRLNFNHVAEFRDGLWHVKHKGKYLDLSSGTPSYYDTSYGAVNTFDKCMSALSKISPEIIPIEYKTPPNIFILGHSTIVKYGDYYIIKFKNNTFLANSITPFISSDIEICKFTKLKSAMDTLYKFDATLFGE